MSVIDRVDESLKRLRTSHPIWGWTVTLLLMPLALLLGLGLVLLVLLGGPVLPVVGLVWLVIFSTLSVIGRYREEYRPERLMNSAAGNVIMVLGILITVLLILLFLRLPDRLLERLWGPAN